MRIGTIAVSRVSSPSARASSWTATAKSYHDATPASVQCQVRLGGDGPPAPNRWAERDPVAARRLARVRGVVTTLAGQLSMPPENLVQPEAVRRLAWQPPAAETAAVVAALRASGVRDWQVALVGGPLAAVLANPDPAAAAEPADAADPAEPPADPEDAAEPLPDAAAPSVARPAAPPFSDPELPDIR